MSGNQQERRTNQRIALTEQIFVKTVSAEQIVIYPDELDVEGGELATTVDVSHCGLRLYLSDAVVEGSTLVLWIEFTGRQEKLLLTGLVIWAHPSGEGFLVGVKLEENTKEDVEAWQTLIAYKNETGV